MRQERSGGIERVAERMNRCEPCSGITCNYTGAAIRGMQAGHPQNMPTAMIVVYMSVSFVLHCKRQAEHIPELIVSVKVSLLGNRP